jgi:hypothetical protein
MRMMRIDCDGVKVAVLRVSFAELYIPSLDERAISATWSFHWVPRKLLEGR